MNSVVLLGRLVADPEVRYSDNQMCIASYRLAVDRRGNETDFISIKAFGKNGEFAEKYLKKGMKIGVRGRIQTGSYTNKDGVKIYTTDVIAEEHDFCESKAKSDDGFMKIDMDIEVDELPFS